MRRWLASRLCVALLALGTATALQQAGPGTRQFTSAYQRPPAADPLPLDHQLLQRHSSHPHAPEQVHTTLDGPGVVSISWVGACLIPNAAF